MKILNNLDLCKNQLQNAVVQPLASAPNSPVEGQIYYNSTDKKSYQYNGTGWVELGGGEQIFWATYNTTTYTAILAAYNAGKIVLMLKDGYALRMTGTGTKDNHAICRFLGLMAALDTSVSIAYSTCNDENTWTSTYYQYAPLASPTFTGTPTAPTPTAGDSSTKIATTAFVANAMAALDAMVFKGTIGAAGDSPTVTALPDTHTAGWTYRVVTAGTYAGKTCEVGDLIICVNSGTTAADADWTVAQTNIDGAVTGPSSATSGHIPTFNGASGKVIQDGYGVASSVSNDATTIPTTKAVYDAIAGASGGVSTATGTISTSATSATVSYSGTFVGAYATQGGEIVNLDIAPGSGSVVFTAAAAPASAVTCVVVYVPA